MAKKNPDPTDKHVGSRVRMQRLIMGMSQTELAVALGLTFQQVQKYEKGANRIGASRLQKIAQILQVTPSFFFEGGPRTDSADIEATKASIPTYICDFLATNEGLNFARAFIRIKDAKLRRMLVNFAELIVAEKQTELN